MGWHDDAVPFALDAHVDHDGAQLVLAGELDAQGAAELRDAVAAVAAPGRRVTVDLTGLTFIDSTGCTALLDAADAARAAGATFSALAAPEGPVIRILRLTCVAQVISLETVDAA